MGIFNKRINLKPYEYPHLLKYKDAIRHSYWLHTEIGLASDIQDFHVNITLEEQEVIKRTLLAISQIEVAVKTFWTKIYDKMPKPEIGMVGVTFGESENRHADAYSFLLEQLGLNEEFEKIYEIPAIIDRVNYLQQHLSGSNSSDNKQYALSLLLFSVFIEHISLFGQFLIIMAFHKHKNLFKGLSNMVEATSKEEDIHGQFGIAIIDILRSEHPEWFSSIEFNEGIIEACVKAEKAENKILDWIFERGELDFLPKDVVINFLRNRFNKALTTLQLKPIFNIDSDLLKQTQWFDEELLCTKEDDFFNKRPTTYSKKLQSVTSDDLF